MRESNLPSPFSTPTILLALLVLGAILGAVALLTPGTNAAPAAGSEASERLPDPPFGEPAPPPPEGLAVATFAGGCFWCMEPPYDAIDGVLSTTSGYIDGRVENPSYEQVSSGGTGHTEAVRVVYDPERVSYEELLDVFWRNVDPTDAGGQFCDRGSQYRTGIYVHDAEQRRAAEASKSDLVEGDRIERVVTEIEEAGDFWPAETYHQDFYEKNPIRYKTYRKGCRRDARLDELWG